MLEFDIPSMSCGHCVGVITQAVKQADPQARVDIDLPAHRVRVETAVARAALVAALSEAGYAPA